MRGFGDLFDSFAHSPLAPWSVRVPALIARALAPSAHGNLALWQAAVDALPPLVATRADLQQGCIEIGDAGEMDAATREALREQLQILHPWRKGPFRLFGLLVDAEWRSDLKWARVSPHLSSLKGRRILDVGCGNGYYALRMLGAGADLVIGVDPTLLYFHQFQVVRHFLEEARAHVLPLPLEALEPIPAFDTVFSMGVLYHRRDPLEHLRRLRAFLAPAGELVLETLVIEGGPDEVLVPKDRYARMKNVWAIPSVAAAIRWLHDAGFAEVRCVDVTRTSIGEQRSTPWMRFESLSNFLAGENTVEGYPSPTRAVFVAHP